MYIYAYIYLSASPAAQDGEKEPTSVTGQWAAGLFGGGGLTAVVASKLMRGVQGKNEISIVRLHCVLQCVAVCCSVMQCVAENCSELQCVAVSCNCVAADAWCAGQEE